MSEDDNNKKTFIQDLSGKFLFMRHGQTTYNILNSDPTKRYNPDLCDSPLTENGINQTKEKREVINALNIEKVYVSPYYRAIQTLVVVLETYPGIENLKVIVHPKIGELISSANDFIFDIKKTKKEFNMNSKVKIDWSYFDEYVKNSKYDENFFYFENINLLDEKEKDEEYLKLKSFYDKGDMKNYKEELRRFLEEKNKTMEKYESFKHSYERFQDFKTYLKNEHKGTYNDNDRKILCVSHSNFIKSATSPVPFLQDKMYEKTDHLYKPQNGEIMTLII